MIKKGEGVVMKFEWDGADVFRNGIYVGNISVANMYTQSTRWHDRVGMKAGHELSIEEAKAACEASVKQSIIELAKELE